MPDPIMLAIAGAVAGKTTEVVIKGGRRAYDALAAIVKRRFATEPSAQAALTAAEADPEANTERLATALEFVAAGDPEFDTALRQAAEPLINAGPNSIVNSNSGVVQGDSIQIGRVNTFNHKTDGTG